MLLLCGAWYQIIAKWLRNHYTPVWYNIIFLLCSWHNKFNFCVYESKSQTTYDWTHSLYLKYVFGVSLYTHNITSTMKIREHTFSYLHILLVNHAFAVILFVKKGVLQCCDFCIIIYVLVYYILICLDQ